MNLSKTDQAKVIHAVCGATGLRLDDGRELINNDIKTKKLRPGGLAVKRGQYSREDDYQYFYNAGNADTAKQISKFLGRFDDLFTPSAWLVSFCSSRKTTIDAVRSYWMNYNVIFFCLLFGR